MSLRSSQPPLHILHSNETAAGSQSIEVTFVKVIISVERDLNVNSVPRKMVSDEMEQEKKAGDSGRYV
jgi:hypothetical protein